MIGIIFIGLSLLVWVSGEAENTTNAAKGGLALSPIEKNGLRAYCRENNLIIKGVPNRVQENLYSFFESLSLRIMKFTKINASDIEAVYRLPSANEDNHPIIVKLRDKWTMLQFFVVYKIRKAKDTSNEEIKKIHIEIYEGKCTDLLFKNSKRFEFYNLSVKDLDLDI